MTVKNFIPIVWSDLIWQAWVANAVLGNAVNRDYEGEIRQFGDTVKINGVVPPTIIDYIAAGRKISPEAIKSVQVELVIDQGKAYAFNVDDIDAAQAKGNLRLSYVTAAGRALANDADLAIGTGLSAAAKELPDTDFESTSAGFLARLNELATQLDKINAPKINRICIISPTFKQGLLNPQGGGSVQLTSTGYSVEGAVALQEAILGRLFGFTIIESNNVPDTYAIAYVKDTYAYASQLIETEALRDSNSFADTIRGLHVYGHAPIGKLAGTKDNAIFKIKGTPAKGGGTGGQIARVYLSSNTPAPGETVGVTATVENSDTVLNDDIDEVIYSEVEPEADETPKPRTAPKGNQGKKGK